MIAGKLKLYFDGSWTHFDTSHEILLKVVVDNGSDIDNVDYGSCLVWRVALRVLSKFSTTEVGHVSSRDSSCDSSTSLNSRRGSRGASARREIRGTLEPLQNLVNLTHLQLYACTKLAK